MRILVLNADYPRFLSWLYLRQPGLGSAGYAAQMAARNASLFGVADFYSRNFSALGHSAAEIHVNNAWLQTAWAREHGMAVKAAETAIPSGSTSLPGWLERAVTPLKPMLRPLARKIGLSPRLDAQAEAQGAATSRADVRQRENPLTIAYGVFSVNELSSGRTRRLSVADDGDRVRFEQTARSRNSKNVRDPLRSASHWSIAGASTGRSSRLRAMSA